MDRKFMVRTIGICLLTLGLVAAGARADLRTGADTGSLSLAAGNEVYAEAQFDESVIEDNTLQVVMRVLINYSAQNDGASLYDAMTAAGYDPYTQDITKSDFTMTSTCRTPITDSSIVEEFSGSIILTPYTTISTLKGISCAKNASSVTLPYQLDSSDMTSVPASALSGMSALTEAVMPAAVTEIGSEAFKGCSALATIKTYSVSDGAVTVESGDNIADLANITTIGSSAFYGCAALPDPTFGSKLTAIGSSAFYGAGITSLAGLAGTSITAIEDDTFNGCDKLTEAACPDTLTSIGERAFANCGSLTDLSFPVYASLAQTMLLNDTQEGLTLTPTLGKYTDAFEVPSGKTADLPANAFTRCKNAAAAVVDGGSSDFSGKYDQSKAAFVVTGGAAESTGGKLRATATLEFPSAKSGGYSLSVDYPVNVVMIHVDPDTIAFDDSKFVLDNGSAGTIVENEGEDPVLYIDQEKTGKTLTLAAVAASLNENYPGTITDEVTWSVTGDALTRTSQSTSDGSAKFTAFADFTVGEGTAKVTVSFDDGSDEHPSATLKVAVVEGLDDLHVFIDSLGSTYRDPQFLTMPVGQTDKISATAAYSALAIKSSNEEVVSVSASGDLTALKAGTANVTVGAVTGGSDTTYVIAITVVEAGGTVPPVLLEIEEVENTASYGNAYVGEPVTYTVNYLPDYSTTGVSWSVDDTENAALETLENGDAELSIGSMPESGIVKLTATAEADGYSAKTTLSIRAIQRTSELEVREQPIVINKADTGVKFLLLSDDDSRTDGFIRKPAGSVEPVTFASGDQEILAVGEKNGSYSDDGTVTFTSTGGLLYYKGLKEGKTKLTATTEKGVTAELDVAVTSNPIRTIDYYLYSMSKNHQDTTSLTMPLGQTDRINPIISYKNSDGDKYDYVRFSSSRDAVVTVDSDGELVAAGEGTATITVFSASGSYKRTFTVTVVDPETSIDPLYIDIEPAEYNGGVITLNAHDSKTLTAICRPTYAQQTIQWEIGNESVASLDKTEGESVTLTSAADYGSTTLTAKYGSISSKTYTVMTVTRTTKLEFLDDEPTILSGDVGNIALSETSFSTSGVMRTPSESFENVTFTTSDSSVLMLGTSEDDCTDTSVMLYIKGAKLYYKGLRDGKATIKATTDGGVTDTWTVTVIEPATGLSCANASLTIKRQSSQTMQVSRTPSNSSDPISYASANSKIATVDATGKITAVKVGTTTVTATSKYGKASAVCKVTVVKSDADIKEEAIQGVYSSKLPKVKIKKPASKKKSITAKWKKLSKKNRKKCKGIEVWVAYDKKFTKGRQIKKAGSGKTSKVVKSLKKNKTYYVKVRTYKYSGGVKYVGKWSKIRKIKTKK